MSDQTRPEDLPNDAPRPPEELAALKRIWATPRGWALPSAVNNTVIGLFYIGAAFLFFCLAGVLALVMRAQLAVPGNDLVSQELYNQIFTVHGTTMMFLFAVPAVEALGVLFLPQMLAARDLPFPRLSAFAIWAYVIGGLVFFSTVFYGLAPDGGWFMYPPLTLTAFSPGDNADFWLLGIGFIEISAIAGAIEIIVGVLKTRPPGMTLAKMPIFAWAMLVFAGMIVFAFPAVILATMLLEVERAFGWPFFTAAAGGDPLLWQHLFWFFGHPEVYIIFLPAAGLVSMIVSTAARGPLIGHNLIVVALIATGFFSFGLWVHHMFTTGLPALSTSFFAAASMAVAVPSGIQIFSWIATIASSKKRFRLTTPSLFVLGAMFIFVMGGLTGVMVAMVPFDWQAHDTYFVVAHFHYVLIGGMVFPLFAAFYYWAPMVSKKLLSERLGRWAFGLMFTGFHIAFLPMHLTGLRGMPRRVWTYPADLGWDVLNLISTIGAFTIAAGVAVFIADLIRNFRVGEGGAENPWDAGTLEFLPQDTYSARSIPRVTSREPLWDQPTLAEEVREGRHYLPYLATGGRETLVTSPITAEPQYVARMPGAGWTHVLAAVFTAACFLLLTIKVVVPAIACGLGAIVCVIVWLWPLDRGAERGMVPIARNEKVPDYVTGPMSHGWWAMVILMLVAGSLYLAYVFSYLYLWTVSPEVWPLGGNAPAPPNGLWPLSAGALMAASAGAFVIATRTLGPNDAPRIVTPLLILLGALGLAAGVGVEIFGHWQGGLRPTDSSYGAMVYMAGVLTAQIAVAVLIMAGFQLARHYTGRLDCVRKAGLEATMLLACYGAAQGLVGLLLVHGFPRAAG
jgi:cytochrome c oxidase subunit I+III